MEPDEYIAMITGSKNLKQGFDAYLEGGFSEDQALKMVVYWSLLSVKFEESTIPGGKFSDEDRRRVGLGDENEAGEHGLDET